MAVLHRVMVTRTETAIVYVEGGEEPAVRAWAETHLDDLDWEEDEPSIEIGQAVEGFNPSTQTPYSTWDLVGHFWHPRPSTRRKRKPR